MTNTSATRPNSSDFAAFEAKLEPLLPVIAEHGPTSDKKRKPQREVMAALASSGLLRLLVPRQYGGAEIHLADFVRITERIASVHGSTAWTAMTCNEEAGIASAYLEPESLIELFETAPATIVSGSGTPRGQATPSDQGWSVSGRWPFVSGCTASDRIVLSSIVTDSDPVRLCFILVPTAEVLIEENWDTLGLRGTGSHDVVLDSHIVDARWGAEVAAFSLPRPSTPFYQLPSGLRFPFPKVGVATGLARAALAEFVALAEGKRPQYGKGELRQRATAQAAMAVAEAKLAAGRAWVFEMIDELWHAASEERPIPNELHARCRLAASYAVASSIEAIELVAAEAGTTANFVGSPLGQLLADARAVAGHFTVAPYQQATAGRVLLGLPADDRNF